MNLLSVFYEDDVGSNIAVVIVDGVSPNPFSLYVLLALSKAIAVNAKDLALNVSLPSASFVEISWDISPNATLGNIK